MDVGKREAAPPVLADGTLKFTHLLAPSGELVVSSLAGGPVQAGVPPAGTSTLTNIAQNAASVNLVAANVNRRGIYIFNDSASNLLLKYGAVASITSFSEIIGPQQSWPPDSSWDGWTGRIDGIWLAAGGGAARITELTA